MKNVQQKRIVLYNNEVECCGCGACLNICPRSAISMKANEAGCFYPAIDEQKCVNCGLCKTVCSFQNKKLEPSFGKTYAAMSKDDKQLRLSASGGVFSAIAQRVLEQNGVVYGCAMECEADTTVVKHIGIESIKDLPRLQGSKYVQSDIDKTYSAVKEQLEQGRLVLFSGTPCQIDGLKGFLRNKAYQNFYTIDIICHGVPGQKMFQDYIEHLEKKLKGKVVNFCFRDKSSGWGLNPKIVYRKSNGVIKEKTMPFDLSSYYNLFLKSEIYRENCYSCKYAGPDRVGDITIGDYWRLNEQHPEYLSENGGELSVEKGISCIIANNSQGEKLLEQFADKLVIKPSEFEKAAKWNRQLNAPSQHTDLRKAILDKYAEKGYAGVEKQFIKYRGMRYYARLVKSKIKS